MSDDTAHSSPEHHAKTLVRGGRPLPPRLLYMGMQSLDALLFSLAYTIYGLYAVQAATLGPLELTLVGTIMELAIFLTEVPTGMVADLYSRRLSVILGLCIIGTGIAVLGAVPTFWCIALGSVLWGVGGTFISGAHQAWLADEIGEVEAAPVYLRATQLSQVGGLVGIPLSVALASIYYLSGHSLKELGALLGISPATAKMRLHRARQHLRKEAITMVENALTQQQLGPHFTARMQVADMTILFTDMAGTTRLLEQLPPEEALTLLYTYMNAIAQILVDHGATLRRG